MKRHATNIVVHSVGGMFIVAGIGAGFVPLVPGFVFIIIGLYIISLRSEWLRGRIAWARVRFPSFGRKMTAFESLKARLFRLKFWA